ncbi:hypothetical protein [Mycolicibacterium thermoresistibile]
MTADAVLLCDGTALEAAAEDTSDTVARRGAPGSAARPGEQPHMRASPLPIGLVLARPVLLSLCVVAGGIVGFTAWDGGKGYEATSLVEFTTNSQDVALVRLEAQTLAEKMTTPAVLERAAAYLAEPVPHLVAGTSAKRFDESYLISVTATGADAESAIARANAVAQAGVDELRDSVLWRVGIATMDGNSLLQTEGLSDPDAEAARRAQVGTAIGGRQEGLKGQSGSWSVARHAADASPAGLTRPLTTAVGLAVGLFVGCLAAVLLGTRGLRPRSAAAVRRLAPGVEVLTPAQTPQLAGRMAETGESYLVVVTTRGASTASDEFVGDLTRLLGMHDKTVTTVAAPASPDESSVRFLRVDALTEPDVDSDVLLLRVDAGTESAAMLEGRSGFRTVIVMRRGRTPASAAVAAARSYRNATPTMLLAK